MSAVWPPGRELSRPVEAIVIHHSATDDSRTLSWGAIERTHLERGFDAVGYHAAAELIRDGFQVLIGRPTDRTGAHVKERDADGVRWNHKSLGFCFVGDYDKRVPPQGLLEVAARRWIVPQLRIHGLTTEALIPHHQLAGYKSCPGEKFPMGTLRDICQTLLKEA